jgi:hypothetical protein
MKKLILKFTVGLLALAAGISLVWASGIFQILFPRTTNPALPATDTSITQPFNREKSGKVLVRFKEFEYGKGWLAAFEIINDTTQPIFYVGSKRKDKFDYCTLAVKHEEPFPANHDGKIDNLSFDIRSNCYYSTGMFLQTLKSGESVTLTAWEHEVRSLGHINDAKLDTKAQIGFEFFTGEEKRREVVWSEEITFPFDEYR